MPAASDEEAFQAMWPGDPCAIDPTICDPDWTPKVRPGVRLSSGRSFAACAAGAGGDLDKDAILDTCEYEIAHAFRPYLARSIRDRNLGREPYWAVRKCDYGSQSQCVMIFYAFAYYFDGGVPSLWGFSRHQGDSEFVVLEVLYSDSEGKWILNWYFLSAHWGTFNESDSEALHVLHPNSPLSFPGDGARPMVWVAEEKHANYSSRSRCNGGGSGWDTCMNNTSQFVYLQEISVLPDANLGSSSVPLVNRTTSREGKPATEYFWEPGHRFRGWLSSSGSAAGVYGDALTAFGFWTRVCEHE